MQHGRGAVLSNFGDQIRGADTRVCRAETRLGACDRQLPQVIAEFFHVPGTSLLWTSHAARCPRQMAVSDLAFARAAFLTATTHRLVKHPPGSFYLDGSSFWIAPRGPFFLRQPAIARLVVDSLCRRCCAWALLSWRRVVVMANHVHFLLLPKVLSFRGVWLLYDDGPATGRIEPFLVFDDVESPVGVEVAAEV